MSDRAMSLQYFRATQAKKTIMRYLAASERVTAQLCHIAKCDEAEVKRQVARTGQDIHGLRAYYLANGDWPLKSTPIDK